MCILMPMKKCYLRPPLFLLKIFVVFAVFSNGFAAGAEEIVLTFGGDLMAHRVMHRIENYSESFTAVLPLFRTDDLTFANMEFVSSANLPVSGFPLFNAPPAYVEAAVIAGVDVMATANNHSFDHGDRGLNDTIATLDSVRKRYNGLPYTSGFAVPGRSFAEPTTIRAGSRTVGFLAITQFSNERPADRNIYSRINVVDGSNRDAFVRYLEEVTGNFDLFVLSYHGDWVEEYRDSAIPEKRVLFTRFLDAGVDIVWGHHSHVPQETELRPYGPNNRLVIYSSGNLLGAQGYHLSANEPDPADPWASTHDSFLHRVRISFDDDGPSVVTLDMIPVYQRILPGRQSGVVLETLSTVLYREPDDTWRRYYRERAERLRALSRE